MDYSQYYTSQEASDLADLQDLEDYLYGWEDAVIYGEDKVNDVFYKKQYVDLYVSR